MNDFYFILFWVNLAILVGMCSHTGYALCMKKKLSRFRILQTVLTVSTIILQMYFYYDFNLESFDTCMLARRTLIVLVDVALFLSLTTIAYIMFYNANAIY